MVKGRTRNLILILAIWLIWSALFLSKSTFWSAGDGVVSIVFYNWLALTVIFFIFGRHEAVVVNCLGPALAVLGLLPFVEYTDPDWLTIVGVLSIGALVSMAISIAWVIIKRVVL